ncbi:hypothetical protein BJ878DRAFT_428679 [Calycina marina]|uniref:STEEP1 domain-containing protein n=1 Tax=Calycina marina TaxID=1763456 RepID=A0A9P8CBR7_9HELO|nr:hypothetical protein BJ878DRAFT_428679 [Calycina marina]
MPPQLHTYHCICSTLLLASTHELSILPRRSNESSLDHAIILPLSSRPSLFGTTTLQNLTPDKNTTIIRKEDGFERRLLWKCTRCMSVVGYEICDAEDVVLGEFIEGEDGGEWKGRILYVLPGGVRTTEGMGRKIGEADVELGVRVKAVLGKV